MLVVSQPPPLAFLVFLLSDWWEACATFAAVDGGAPAVSRWHAHLHSLATPIHALSGLGPKVEKHFPHQRILLLSRSTHRARFGSFVRSNP